MDVVPLAPSTDLDCARRGTGFTIFKRLSKICNVVLVKKEWEF